ncbi:hypothetical protein Microterr_06340 [Microbacterium terricola]|uniref:Uncharacterized protein n=1 Tax=Microbacterium terricola TaxID=344163 RepID=A0ABM8DWG6_9MICO|nr:hypothetical protein Microterr_06340 [Microbacterium terricola]
MDVQHAGISHEDPERGEQRDAGEAPADTHGPIEVAVRGQHVAVATDAQQITRANGSGDLPGGHPDCAQVSALQHLLSPLGVPDHVTTVAPPAARGALRSVSVGERAGTRAWGGPARRPQFRQRADVRLQIAGCGHSSLNCGHYAGGRGRLATVAGWNP